MSRTLISVDLDWFNGKSNPLEKLTKLLCHIPKTTPVIMTVEHHEFIPLLRRWIKSGKVKTPFNVINLDEHHDYYDDKPPYDPYGTAINCANWGFRLPLEWYNQYTWIRNDEDGTCDWAAAKVWLKNHGIKYSVRKQPRLKSLKSKIVAAVFCVSPDYLYPSMIDTNDTASKAIDIIVRHFNMKRAPLRIKNTDACKLNGWRISPRPLRVR